MEVKKELKKRNLVSPFFQILTQILNLLKEGSKSMAPATNFGAIWGCVLETWEDIGNLPGA